MRIKIPVWMGRMLLYTSFSQYLEWFEDKNCKIHGFIEFNKAKCYYKNKKS